MYIDDLIDEYENQETLDWKTLNIGDRYLTFSNHVVRLVQIWEPGHYDVTAGRMHDLTTGIFGHFTMSWLKEKVTPETHPQHFL